MCQACNTHNQLLTWHVWTNILSNSRCRWCAAFLATCSLVNVHKIGTSANKEPARESGWGGGSATSQGQEVEEGEEKKGHTHAIHHTATRNLMNPSTYDMLHALHDHQYTIARGKRAARFDEAEFSRNTEKPNEAQWKREGELSRGAEKTNEAQWKWEAELSRGGELSQITNEAEKPN